MTKLEILETCNYDLNKAKEMFNWLSDESVTETGCPILDNLTCKSDKVAPVHLILKSGKRISNLTKIKAMKLELKDIKGIAVPALNGEEICFYPKIGKSLQLLPETQGKKWRAEKLTEADTVFKDIKYAWDRTQELFELDSEAAKVCKEILGQEGYIAGLQQLFSVMHCVDEINNISKLIKGADLINKDSNFWSSCRRNTYGAWYYGGGYGCAYGSFFCNTGGVLFCLL